MVIFKIRPVPLGPVPNKMDERNIQIGLDIGSRFVKAVAILHSTDKPQLIAFSIKPIGENCIQDVKDAYEELKLTKKKVVTSISGPSVIARYVEMPSMTESELKSATRFEAEKVIPFSLNQVLLDSTKMEDLSENRMRVLIVAAKKDTVDMRVQMLYEAGLEPSILDVDSFAVMNTFVDSGIHEEATACGLLNIGARRTNLNVTKGRTSYLSRDIEIGGEDITKAISDKLSLPQDKGEKIKIEKLSHFTELPPEEKEEIEAAIGELLSHLAEEVRLSLDFYETHYAGNVDKVYISGGTSQSEGISRLLKENLGCDTLKWDPLTNIDVAEGLDYATLNKFQSQLTVAIGLGLRGTDL